MGSFKHPRLFLADELEIIDRVYEAAWARVNARYPFRDTEQDEKRRKALRKMVVDQTGTDRVEFGTLCEKVLANLHEPWFTAPSS